MAEIAYKIAKLAILATMIIALLTAIGGLIDVFVPEDIARVVSTIVTQGGSYIYKARALVNYLLFPGTEIWLTILLSLMVFNRPVIWLMKLAYKVYNKLM